METKKSKDGSELIVISRSSNGCKQLELNENNEFVKAVDFDYDRLPERVKPYYWSGSIGDWIFVFVTELK